MASWPAPKLDELLENFAHERGQIVHWESLPPREARYRDPEREISPQIVERLRSQDIDRLYEHQAVAVDEVRRGNDVVVVTGTASGKSLCYNIPVLETVLEEPRARALFLFPTKALAQDQLKVLRRFLDEGEELMASASASRSRGRSGLAGETPAGQLSNPGRTRFRAGTYDGDTPSSLRNRLRDESNILLTNPDMLHAGILPNHARWADFFTRLRYIVIDEIHIYRGIFGSHVANVLGRLRRICRHYGSDPIWICSSATISNPGGLAEQLIGRAVRVIDDDGSPRGKKSFLFWNPPALHDNGMERRSSNFEAKDIFVRLVREGYQTIAFVKARLLAEVILRYCQDDLRPFGGGLASRIRAYRAGYLPEERRKIESALFDGELLGVISTNALELGIDVGSLDVAIMVGYPGTIASTWQQAGRAGRRQSDSIAILVGHNAPIDQYLMQNPEYFFTNNPETAVLDPSNPHILLNHLRCAAYEIPIPATEENGYGEFAPAILDLLQDEKLMREVKGRWFYTDPDYPAASFSLRNSGENVYTIVDTTEKNRVIGTIDEPSAFSQMHPQAVYLHDGETFLVDDLDLSERVAYLHRADIDYYTQSVSDSHIDAPEADLEKDWRKTRTFFGNCSLHEKVTMFKKIKFGSRDSLGYGQIDLPHTTLHTTALWFVPPADALSRCLDLGRVPADGLIGIANVLSEVVALHVMCDPHDLGTVVDMKNQVGPTLFLYDKYPGGLGYGQQAYHRMEEVIPAALKLIQGCPCLDGCPSCVGSPLPPSFANDPDAFTKGKIPDKEAAQILLHGILEMNDYVPKVPLEGIRAQRAKAWIDKTTKVENGEERALAETGRARRGSGPIARTRHRMGAEDTVRDEIVRSRDHRPLPDDLRKKLKGQIERLAESRPGPARRKSYPTERVGS